MKVPFFWDMKPRHWMTGSRRFEIVPLYFLETSRNEYSVTPRRTSGELNSQPQCCEYSKTRKLLIFCNMLFS